MGYSNSVPVFDDIGTEIDRYELIFLKSRNHIKFTECNLVRDKNSEPEHLRLISQQTVSMEYYFLSCVIKLVWNNRFTIIYRNHIKMIKYPIGYEGRGKVYFEQDHKHKRNFSKEAIFRLRHRKELPDGTYVKVPLQLEIDIFGLVDDHSYSTIILSK